MIIEEMSKENELFKYPEDLEESDQDEYDSNEQKTKQEEDQEI